MLDTDNLELIEIEKAMHLLKAGKDLPINQTIALPHSPLKLSSYPINPANKSHTVLLDGEIEKDLEVPYLRELIYWSAAQYNYEHYESFANREAETTVFESDKLLVVYKPDRQKFSVYLQGKLIYLVGVSVKNDALEYEFYQVSPKLDLFGVRVFTLKDDASQCGVQKIVDTIVDAVSTLYPFYTENQNTETIRINNEYAIRHQDDAVIEIKVGSDRTRYTTYKSVKCFKHLADDSFSSEYRNKMIEHSLYGNLLENYPEVVDTIKRMVSTAKRFDTFPIKGFMILLEEGVIYAVDNTVEEGEMITYRAKDERYFSSMMYTQDIISGGYVMHDSSFSEETMYRMFSAKHLVDETVLQTYLHLHYSAFISAVEKYNADVTITETLHDYTFKAIIDGYLLTCTVPRHGVIVYDYTIVTNQ